MATFYKRHRQLAIFELIDSIFRSMWLRARTHFCKGKQQQPFHSLAVTVVHTQQLSIVWCHRAEFKRWKEFGVTNKFNIHLKLNFSGCMETLPTTTECGQKATIEGLFPIGTMNVWTASA